MEDTPSKLDQLRNRALDEATKTGTLSDIAQAIAVAKTVAEERKANEELASARRSIRSAHIQSIVTAITAMLSVLGLIGTSFYNIAQISATREQVETTEWRDLLSSLDNPKLDIAQSLTVPFRLRSFANSSRYSQDARLIAAAVMSKITDADAFRQLFTFIFADQKENKFGTMTEIQIQLRLSFLRNANACAQASQPFKFPTASYRNVCWDGYTDKQVQDFGLKVENTDVWAMRKAYQQQSNEMVFMSTQIATVLPSVIANKIGNKDINLTNIFLSNVDLSNIDFAGIDISGAVLDGAILTNAKLRPTKFDGASFNTANWWEAATIDR